MLHWDIVFPNITDWQWIFHLLQARLQGAEEEKECAELARHTELDETWKKRLTPKSSPHVTKARFATSQTVPEDMDPEFALQQLKEQSR